MIISLVKESEISCLVDLVLETFTSTFAAVNSQTNINKYVSSNLSYQAIYSEWQQSTQSFYFGKVGNNVVGYVKLVKVGQCLKIERLYVLKEFAGNGYGSQFIEYAERCAQEIEMAEIKLGVWASNFQAITFYYMHGFKATGKEEFILGDDRQVDIVMSKQIGGKYEENNN